MLLCCTPEYTSTSDDNIGHPKLLLPYALLGLSVYSTFRSWRVVSLDAEIHGIASRTVSRVFLCVCFDLLAAVR